MTRQAAKGGEVGENGHFYEGGQFLPEGKTKATQGSQSKKGTKKVEIEPYKWSLPVDGKRPIYMEIKDFVKIRESSFGKKDWKCELGSVNYKALNFYKIDTSDFLCWCGWFDAGLRWM